MRKIDQKIVVVTRETRLAGLRARYATKSQAAFHLKKAVERELMREALAEDVALGAELLEEVKAGAAAEFHKYEEEEETYTDAVEKIRRDLDDLGPKVQVIDRAFVPNFVFGPNDVVVTLGQDGLVANTAKYALGRSIVAVNPDPKRIDGILLPFKVEQTRWAVTHVLDGKAKLRQVTLAEALLADGQRMLAFNDLFIGAESHVSARYHLRASNRREAQSSSGVLVSTGAGSTGWLSSIFNMAAGLLPRTSGSVQPIRLNWEDPRLAFVVREPFISKHSSASIVSGMIEPQQEIVIESMMPMGGVIFSDGIESDFLQFNSGAIARIRAAKEHARLVIP